MMLVTDQITTERITTPLPVDADTEPALCVQCGDAAPGDEDIARDEHGWAYTEDGELMCEHCLTADLPAGIYDRAYYG